MVLAFVLGRDPRGQRPAQPADLRRRPDRVRHPADLRHASSAIFVIVVAVCPRSSCCSTAVTRPRSRPLPSSRTRTSPPSERPRMTILIGYIPTPVGEAALDAGLAEAAARGDDVVILNSPRRGSHGRCRPGGRDLRRRARWPGRRRQGVDRARRPCGPRSRRRRHVRGVVHGDRRPADRDRSAAPQPGRQAGAGQRRAADPARGQRPGARRQARQHDRSGSAGSTSRRSPSPTRRCSTSSGSTSRGRCARSSRCTPTPACWAWARRTPTRPTSRGSRPSPPCFPATTRTTWHGLRRLVVDVLGRETAAPAPVLRRDARRRRRRVDTVYSPFEVACLDLVGPRGRPPGQRPARRCRARPGAVQRLPLLQVGRSPRPARGRVGRGARPRRDRGPGASGWSTGGGSARSSSRAGCSPPDDECAAIEALRAAFPDLPLRLDPNGAWTPETSVAVAERLAGVVEYLEDPTPGIEGMASRRRPHRRAARDQHVRDRLRAPGARDGRRRRAGRAVRPPPLGRAAPLRAARRHHRDVRAGAVDAQQLPPRRSRSPRWSTWPRRRPNLTYACDTHYPWKTQDVITPGVLAFDGRIGGRADRARPRRRARPRPARRAARAVPRAAAYAAGEDTVYMQSDPTGLPAEHWSLVSGPRTRAGAGCCRGGPASPRARCRRRRRGRPRRCCRARGATRSTWVASVRENSSPSRVARQHDHHRAERVEQVEVEAVAGGRRHGAVEGEVGLDRLARVRRRRTPSSASRDRLGRRRVIRVLPRAQPPRSRPRSGSRPWPARRGGCGSPTPRAGTTSARGWPARTTRGPGRSRRGPRPAAW